SVVRAVFLVKARGADAVGVAGDGERPSFQLGKEQVGDGVDVVNVVGLGDAALGPERLVEVGQLDLAPADPDPVRGLGHPGSLASSCSSRQASGSLSLRKPRNAGWRRRPVPVSARYSTVQTSLGSTQTASPAASCGGSAKGHFAVTMRSKACRARRFSRSVKPEPAWPTQRKWPAAS